MFYGKSKILRAAASLVSLRFVMGMVGAALCLVCLSGASAAPQGSLGDWPSYGNDSGMSKYSPLTQITPENVTRLQLAWSFRYGDIVPPAARPDGSMPIYGKWSMTPLIIGGVVYAATPSPVNSVVALDATSGAVLWKWGTRGGVGGRGLAYWPGDAGTKARILIAVRDGLMALDAATGTPSAGFGQDGLVLLDQDLPVNLRIHVPNPVAIYKNVMIAGSISTEGAPPGPPGDIRGFDIRTGKPLWRFHTIARPGDPNFKTWPDAKSGINRPGANVWAMFTVDQKTGTVYAPIGSPGYDWYGGDRLGDNLYGNSLVALSATTGRRLWHYQLVHHDLNDFDLASAPTLLDIKHGGRSIPALAQATKMGMIFFLDRRTGKPIYGVDEVPVPQSTTPGEKSSPTQPIVRKPAMLARTGMTREEVTNLSPASRDFCGAALDKYGGRATFYAPVSTFGTISFPGSNGGMDWGGLSYNPQLGYVFANITNVGIIGQLVKQTNGDPVTYTNGLALQRFVDLDQYPCQIPPWGEMAAINVHTGDIVWKVPLGSYKELEAKGFKDYGAPNLGGSIATASGLVFIAATNDKRFRAFDARTGKVVWQYDMEASGNATPATYMGKDGKQYLVITSSGPGNWRNVGPTAGDRNNALLAFRLP